MKDISALSNSKNVIAGEKVSREGIYYASLFGAALITSIVLLIISIVKHNKGLTVYSSILIPVFLIAGLAAARYIMMSKDTVYLKDGNLVIKSFFTTRKFKISEITKLTAAQNGNDGPTSVNITYGEKTYYYKLNITKEQTADIKRSVSQK